METMKCKLDNFVDNILNLNDDFLYQMCGNRPDLKFFLNSNILYFDDFNKKMAVFAPFFDKNMVESDGDDIVLSGSILTFVNKLKIKDYLSRFNTLKYKMHKLVADIIQIDDRDLMYFLFLSFGDYLYDELKVSTQDIKEIYMCFLTNHVSSDFQLTNVDSDTMLDVIHDISLYIEEFERCGLNLLNYHEMTTNIIKIETNPSSDPKKILYNRLYTNFCICVAARHSTINKISEEDQLCYFINMMLFGIFFDDIEDIKEDISNGTPTYISWLYQNYEYDIFIKKVNQIIAYVFFVNMNALTKYRDVYPDKVELLNLFKIIVLTNFDKTVDELKIKMAN